MILYIILRKVGADSAMDVRPTDGAGGESHGAVAAAGKMAARQEEGVQFSVQTHLTRHCGVL